MRDDMVTSICTANPAVPVDAGSERHPVGSGSRRNMVIWPDMVMARTAGARVRENWRRGFRNLPLVVGARGFAPPNPHDGGRSPSQRETVRAPAAQCADKDGETVQALQSLWSETCIHVGVVLTGRAAMIQPLPRPLAIERRKTAPSQDRGWQLVYEPEGDRDYDRIRWAD